MQYFSHHFVHILHHSEIKLVGEGAGVGSLGGVTYKEAPCTRQSLRRKALPPNTDPLLTATITLWTTIQLFWEERGWDGASAISRWGAIVSKGYKDVVIHVSLLEVVHDGVLVDLAEQHHVIHSAEFDIVALPVVPVPPAPLQQNKHTQCTIVSKTQWDGVD